MKYYYYLFIIILNLPFEGVAQQNVMPRIRVMEELSAGKGYDVLQTSDSLMWFASKNGLHRYDGVEFTTFKPNPADSFAISGVQITDLLEDKRGLLWVGTQVNGLNCFDKATQRFYQLADIANNEVFRNTVVNDIEMDAAGDIWFCVFMSVYKVELGDNFPSDKTDLTVKHYEIDSQVGPLQTNILKLYWTKEQEMLARLTEFELHKWTAEADTFAFVPMDPSLMAANNRLGYRELRVSRMLMRNIFFGGAFFIILAIALLFRYQYNRAKLQNQLAFEQREAERMEELARMKTHFFSNITHEFRTPLTLIIEPLRQVLESPKAPWMDKVKLAKTNSQRLLQLINQLLDLSKLEHKKMTVTLKRGNLLEVVEPILSSFALVAHQKQIQFDTQLPSQLEHFDFDSDKVEKVLFNLVSNAIKFTEKDGTVAVRIFQQSEVLVFEVKDTGIGIDKAQQPYVFDRFYQADASTTRKQQGTGIGLALSKELVELMQGELTIESTLGKGTTARFTIPILKESEENPITEVISAINPSTIVLDTIATNFSTSATDFTIDPNATNVVLLIEDNVELRQFIKNSLEANYQVLEAANGKIGMQLAMEYIPNIIISDVMMPEMDGFDLCKALKMDTKTAHIPIILLTAKTALQSKIKGLKYGADAYMSKPFNLEELVIRIKNLIAIRTALQQKFSQTLEAVNFQKEKDFVQMLSKANTGKDTTISTYDKDFLNNVYQTVEKHIDDENLSVEGLSQKMVMSRTQLHRKLKALLNETPSEFIRNIRLRKAKQLLSQQVGNVTEVAFMVGFSSQKYFSTKFKEKFGISPSEI